MNGPERNFYLQLKRAFPCWDWQRIETITTGVPDVHCCAEGFEFWAELKAPMTRTGATFLRREQYAWGMRRAQHGGCVFVFSRYVDIISIWKFPFQAEPSSKGHVRITSRSRITLSLDQLSELNPRLLKVL